MSKRVYVAAKFEEKELVRQVYTQCRENGLVITYDWTLENATDMVGEERYAYLQKGAQADLEGIRSCDVLILLPHERGKGLYAELGIAIALGKHVIVIGQRSRDSHQCILLSLPQIIWEPYIEKAVIKAMAAVTTGIIPLADALREMSKRGPKSDEETLNSAADYMLELAAFEKVAREQGWSEECNTLPWFYLQDMFTEKKVAQLLDPSEPPRLTLPTCQKCRQYAYEWMIDNGFWTAECPGCGDCEGRVRTCPSCSGSGYVSIPKRDTRTCDTCGTQAEISAGDGGVEEGIGPCSPLPVVDPPPSSLCGKEWVCGVSSCNLSAGHVPADRHVTKNGFVWFDSKYASLDRAQFRRKVIL